MQQVSANFVSKGANVLAPLGKHSKGARAQVGLARGWQGVGDQGANSRTAEADLAVKWRKALGMERKDIRRTKLIMKLCGRART